MISAYSVIEVLIWFPEWVRCLREEEGRRRTIEGNKTTKQNNPKCIAIYQKLSGGRMEILGENHAKNLFCFFWFSFGFSENNE